MDTEHYLAAVPITLRAAAAEYLRFHPPPPVERLLQILRTRRERITTPVPGLLSRLPTQRPPAGWDFATTSTLEPDGSVALSTEVRGPNGAAGFFDRGYHAVAQRLDLRNAFLRNPGMTAQLPAWVADVPVPLVPGRGIPTVQYVTLYQTKLLDIPPGSLRQFKLWRIESLDTMCHLHWLRQRYPQVAVSDLLIHTSSVDYAMTTAMLLGYTVTGWHYAPGKGYAFAIADLLHHFARGNRERAHEHDGLLAHYGLERTTEVWQDFDITLEVVPLQGWDHARDDFARSEPTT